MMTTPTQNFYSSTLTFFNPVTLQIEIEKQLESPPIMKSYGNRFFPKGQFAGIPQGFYVNNDQTTTIVYQEVSEVIEGQFLHTYLGSIGVSIFDKNMQEQNSYLLPETFYLASNYYETMYFDNPYQSHASYFSTQSDSYKWATYLDTNKQKLILYNDFRKNAENIQKGSITTSWDVDDCVAMKGSLTGNKTAGEMVFPQDDDRHTVGMYGATAYDPTTETIAMFIRTRNKGWQNHIVWVKL